MNRRERGRELVVSQSLAVLYSALRRSDAWSHTKKQSWKAEDGVSTRFILLAKTFYYGASFALKSIGKKLGNCNCNLMQHSACSFLLEFEFATTTKKSRSLRDLMTYSAVFPRKKRS